MTDVLRCVGLTKRYGSLLAVDDVSLTIAEGARHALIGPNGAGKSTLFNLLAGTSRPTSGSVVFAGEDVTRRSDAWRSRAGLAKTFQHSSLFLSLSVLDNVAMAAQRLSGDGTRLWRSAARCPGVREASEHCLEQTGLADQAGRRVSELSHGERRQLEVAVALATRPRLLLLDEPTAGMAAAESARFADLVESLPPEVTVLLIEHDLDVVFRLASRISVLHLGRLLADGDPETIRADDSVQRAYLGDRVADELFDPAVGG
jgi:branched-chain amino acid transport system ATP-binding protein